MNATFSFTYSQQNLQRGVQGDSNVELRKSILSLLPGNLVAPVSFLCKRRSAEQAYLKKVVESDKGNGMGFHFDTQTNSGTARGCHPMHLGD